MEKIAYIFPGQGAQVVGMARDFFDAMAPAREMFEIASDVLGRSMKDLIFSSTQEELSQTKNSQVALFVASLSIWKCICTQFPDLQPDFTAGLSLGEYTALVAGGWIDYVDALPIVQARGLNMQHACALHPGSMRVVLGLEEGAIQEVLRTLPEVWIANLNCPGQTVIAGGHTGLVLAADALKAAGAKRVLPLDVAGAFHTPYMRLAQEKMEPLVEQAAVRLGTTRILMNATGQEVKTVADVKKCMLSQVTGAVLWEKLMREMQALAGHKICCIEMGPGKTLQGINSRITGLEGETLSVNCLADLEKVAAKEGTCTSS